MSRRIGVTVVIVIALVIAATVTVFAVTRNDVDRNRIDHFGYSTTAVERVGPQNVVNGTEGDDTIHGNKVGPGKPAQTINGLGGGDRIWGGKGADQINGDAGNDRLHGYHAGADVIDGGPGRDVCVIGETPGGHTNDTLISCEKVKVKPAQGHG